MNREPCTSCRVFYCHLSTHFLHKTYTVQDTLLKQCQCDKMSQAPPAAELCPFLGCDKMSQALRADWGATKCRTCGARCSGHPPRPPKCGTRTFIFCKPALFLTNATG